MMVPITTDSKKQTTTDNSGQRDPCVFPAKGGDTKGCKNWSRIKVSFALSHKYKTTTSNEPPFLASGKKKLWHLLDYSNSSERICKRTQYLSGPASFGMYSIC